MANTLLDAVIDLINDFADKKQGSVEQRNMLKEPIPSIYYIGLGKTGSQSIWFGFLDKRVAHWHSVAHFEKNHKSNLLSENGYDLYDLIIYIGKKYAFKPLIVECVREPVQTYVSTVFELVNAFSINYPATSIPWYAKPIKHIMDQQDLDQLIKKKQVLAIISDEIVTGFKKNNEGFLAPNLWEKHFNEDLEKKFDCKLKHAYVEKDSCKLLVLRYENINAWEQIFSTIGYQFKLTHKNSTQKKGYNIPEYYNFAIESLSLEKSELIEIYKDWEAFYDQTEIEGFVQKWSKQPTKASV